MQRKRKVKIIATLGPSSSDPAVLRALFEAGADVFRLNFSHGSHEDHRRNLESVRALEREAGHPIGVLMDLQGPKLRIGRFAAGALELGVTHCICGFSKGANARHCVQRSHPVHELGDVSVDNLLAFLGGL
jgi:pyruvate kinase